MLALARALQAAGQHPLVVTPAGGLDADVVARRVRRLPDAPLRLRKIGDHLAHVPGALLALLATDGDVAHAFSPSDALATTAWARRTDRPAVVTFLEEVDRAALADRRLRLATVRRAVEGSQAVVAPSAEVAASLQRWLAVDAPVLVPDDAAAHLALYRALRQG